MKRTGWLSGIFLIVVIFLACAPKVTPVEKPPVQESPVQVVSGEIWEKEWESALAAARKESKVTIYGANVLPAIRQVVDQFQFRKKYGFYPEFTQGRGDEIAAKLLSERRAGLFIADLYIGGLSSYFASLKPAGLAEPMEQTLILPEVLDPKLWVGGRLPWADTQRTIFMVFAYPTINLAINTTQVKPDDIKSYYELLNPKWKGKIILSDPTIAGTGGSAFAVLGFKILDLDFFRQLARQELMISRDERLMVDWVARGRYSIVLFPSGPRVNEYMRAGAPIDFVSPVEGTYLTSGGSPVALINKAPHINAAKVFINWYLSREGQTLISQTHGSQSARIDVMPEGIIPLRTRQPGVKYFLDAETEEWLSRDPEYYKAANEIFGQLR